MQITVEIPDATAAELAALWPEPLSWKEQIISLWAERTKEMAELAVRTALTTEVQKEEPDGTKLVAITRREKDLSKVQPVKLAISVVKEDIEIMK